MGYQIKYVLGEWTEEENKLLLPKLEIASEIIKSFGTIGIDRTMNSFNNK
jgi:PTH1 family peptidyl-tRNA hydrolase